MTDKELNEAVARKLGSTVKCGCDCFAPTDQPDNEWTHTLHYSMDIRSAWEIMEYLKSKCFGLSIGHGTNPDFWQCWIEIKAGSPTFARADSAPRAICQAFLKLP